MSYVQRRNGIVVGVCGLLQKGYAEEWLDDSNPEVVAYLNPPAAVDKKAMAFDALMVKTAIDPTAPQAVKDYAATVK